MNIIDCFIYNNEDLILDLRLDYLDKYVKKFIIVEARFTHQGKLKKKFLDLNNFKKYKDKIIHLFIEEFPKDFSNWERENYQRNFIANGLINFNDDDLIMISDIDEIPNLRNINNKIKDKMYVFRQKNFMYKINLLNTTYPIWYGTRMCKKKLLKSPQWLRDLKVKRNLFYKLFKINWNIVNEGGWHFSYLMNSEQIKEKIMAFGHAEYNKPEYVDLDNIGKKINKSIDLFDRKQLYKKINLDNSFPKIIFEKDYILKKWVI